MKEPIRYFALGLITASIILFIVMMLNNNPMTQKDVELDTNEMIDIIKKEGYHVLTSSEYIKITTKNDIHEDEEINIETNNQEAEDKKQKDNNTNKDSEKKKELEINSYTIVIKDKMAATKISELLEKNKIITDAKTFSTYLEKEKLIPLIKPGKYDLKSDMNHSEIAKNITEKK